MASLGSNRVYLQKVAQLEKNRDNRIWLAELWKKYQLECLVKVLARDKELSEQEYKVKRHLFICTSHGHPQTERDGLREKMTNSLVEKKKKMLEERDSADVLQGEAI